MAIMFYWIIAVIWTRSPALLWFRSSHLFGWWRRKQAPTARVMPLLCQFNTIKLLIRIHQRMNNTSSLPILMKNVHKLPTLFYSIMQTMHTRLDWILVFLQSTTISCGSGPIPAVLSRTSPHRVSSSTNAFCNSSRSMAQKWREGTQLCRLGCCLVSSRRPTFRLCVY